ncbi:luciferase domain-containing protein [Streptomyces lincolnensis]|uniref:luciferase domain-containing protein n=1 Tax=Streptomyces lincolnensis TaxID=1915 RepID=UPI0037CD43D2
MTTAVRALTRLVDWPDLVEARPSCGTGRALRADGAEIAHFHSDRMADVHLSAAAIHRLRGDLKGSTAIRLVPASGWVTVRLECESDIDLLMTLVSVALKAHQGGTAGRTAPAVRCNEHRGAAIAR